MTYLGDLGMPVAYTYTAAHAPNRVPQLLGNAVAVSALQWLTDTRDPIPSGHGYVHGSMFFGPFFRGHGERPMTWDHMREVARLSYGDPDALDPYSGYRAKAVAAFFHTKHSVMKDTLPADDFIFPYSGVPLEGDLSLSDEIFAALHLWQPDLFESFQAPSILPKPKPYEDLLEASLALVPLLYSSSKIFTPSCIGMT